MKHLLILISILLLSSPVIGDNHKGETLYGWGQYTDYKWMGFGDKETQPKYQGQVKDGKPNGLGVMTYPDGEKYVGEWKDGKKNGQGTETFPDGGKYVGEWKNGNYHGQGKVSWTSVVIMKEVSRMERFGQEQHTIKTETSYTNL